MLRLMNGVTYNLRDKTVYLIFSLRGGRLGGWAGAGAIVAVMGQELT